MQERIHTRVRVKRKVLEKGLTLYRQSMVSSQRQKVREPRGTERQREKTDGKTETDSKEGGSVC